MLKNILSGWVTAFSMYSILPMPNLPWNKNTMKYAMCFFPMIGAVIGGAVYGIARLCAFLELSELLFSAVLVLTPVLLSGAIHLDGLIDTGDALYSRLEKDRKLEILKDPHIGAFGVILCVAYFIISFGVFGQFHENTALLPLLCLGYILSRGLSGLAMVSFSTAKNSGLAYIFADNASKTTVKITSILYIVGAIGGMMAVNLFCGILILVFSGVGFLWFKKFCYQTFGGLTGDLAGYYLCIMEFMVLCVATFGVRL